MLEPFTDSSGNFHMHAAPKQGQIEVRYAGYHSDTVVYTKPHSYVPITLVKNTDIKGVSVIHKKSTFSIHHIGIEKHHHHR